MSRYIYTSNVGVGNYGGLNRRWGFGDNDEAKAKPRPMAKKVGGPLAKLAKKMAKKRKEEAKKQREAVKHAERERRKREKEEERHEKEEQFERSKIERQIKRELEFEIDEKKRGLDKERLKREIASKKMQIELQKLGPPGVIIPPGMQVAPVAMPPVQMPRGPLPMMAARPHQMVLPQARGPVRPAAITPQQARLGTLAAALASAMLLF